MSTTTEKEPAETNNAGKKTDEIGRHHITGTQNLHGKLRKQVNRFWLVGGTPPKNMSSSVGMMIIPDSKLKNVSKCSKPPTSWVNDDTSLPPTPNEDRAAERQLLVSRGVHHDVLPELVVRGPQVAPEDQAHHGTTCGGVADLHGQLEVSQREKLKYTEIY